jgi:hypothetical protein
MQNTVKEVRPTFTELASLGDAASPGMQAVQAYALEHYHYLGGQNLDRAIDANRKLLEDYEYARHAGPEAKLPQPGFREVMRAVAATTRLQGWRDKLVERCYTWGKEKHYSLTGEYVLPHFWPSANPDYKAAPANGTPTDTGAAQIGPPPGPLIEDPMDQDEYRRQLVARMERSAHATAQRLRENAPGAHTESAAPMWSVPTQAEPDTETAQAGPASNSPLPVQTLNAERMSYVAESLKANGFPPEAVEDITRETVAADYSTDVLTMATAKAMRKFNINTG